MTHSCLKVLILAFICFFQSVDLRAQLPFMDGFESGSLITGGWTVNGSAQISTLQPASGNYCVMGDASWGISRTFSPLSDPHIIVSFHTKASQTNTTCLVFRVLDNLVNTSGGLVFNSAGAIIGVNGPGGTVTLMNYDTNQWYHIQFDFDMVAKQYDIWIDGQLKANDFQFSSSGFTQANLFTWSSIASTGKNWLDDIEILGSIVPLGNLSFDVSDLSYYPQPCSNQLMLRQIPRAFYTLKWIGLDGRLHHSDQYELPGMIPVPDIPSGQYLLELSKPGMIRKYLRVLTERSSR